MHDTRVSNNIERWPNRSVANYVPGVGERLQSVTAQRPIKR